MTATSYRTSSLLSRLNEDWDRLKTRAHTFDELGSIAPMDLVQSLQHSPEMSRAVRDARMHTLVLLAHRGDHIAERVLIQMMLPKAAQLARTTRALYSYDASDAFDIAITGIWEAIRLYNEDLHGSVAAQIGLNALKNIRKSLGAQSTSNPDPVDLEAEDLEHAFADGADIGPSEPINGDSSFDNVVKVLSWALDARVLTRSEIALLARYDLGSDGQIERTEERQRLADDLGLSPEALSKRVWRIRTRLRDAVRQHIQSFGRW